MTEAQIDTKASALRRQHIALHLAHRWFAFLEAPGSDLDVHLTIFHPQVLLSGNRGGHLFARDHESLKAWFAAVPNGVSSHHIVHSNYSTADDGDGLLNMVVAYQSPSNSGMHGSIISYQTRIEFASGSARFTALDKTPILSDTKSEYHTSWSTNRVLARVHAELGGITKSDGKLLAVLGSGSTQVSAYVTATEGSPAYEALVTCAGGDKADISAVCLKLKDDGKEPMPTIEQIEVLALKWPGIV